MEVEIRFKELILWPAHTYSGTCAPQNNKNKIIDTVLVLHLSIFWQVYFIFKSLDLYMWLHDTVSRRKKKGIFPHALPQILPPTKVITRLHFITVHFLPALNSNINGNVQYILFGAHLFSLYWFMRSIHTHTQIHLWFLHFYCYFSNIIIISKIYLFTLLLLWFSYEGPQMAHLKTWSPDRDTIERWYHEDAKPTYGVMSS